MRLAQGLEKQRVGERKKKKKQKIKKKEHTNGKMTTVTMVVGCRREDVVGLVTPSFSLSQSDLDS